jgi:hypothetical protein
VYSRILALLAAISVAVCAGRANASFEPQLTLAEQQTYQEMLKATPAAAHAYMDTRSYVSICSQALKQPSRILEIGVEPEDYNEKYATPDEVKIVKQAIFLWMKATLAK